MADPKRKGVASRKHHVKSRAGCRNCKKRKVKCDEKTPSCGNCIKHNVECEFLTSTRGIPVALRAPPPSLNMADLELLHNFGTRTHATLSERPVVRDFYRVTAVEYGFRHEYIMRTLLAVSACHLAFHRPEQRDHYQALAMSHHQRATKTAMELMGNPTPAEAESLFLFSGLTIYFALGCPRRDDRFLLVGESGFPDWMFLLQGTRTFIAIAGERLGGVLAPLINNAKDCWEAREGYAGPGGAEVHRRLDELRDLIRRRRTDDDDDDARRLAAYVHALDELHLSFSLFDGGDGDGRRPAVRCDLTDAFVWIHEVAGDLLPLLRDATPEAVAIFAFFSVFLKRAGSQWYVQGWADHLIARCYDLLDEEHRLWIQWPLEEIGWIPRAGPDSRYSGDQGTPSSYSQTPS